MLLPGFFLNCFRVSITSVRYLRELDKSGNCCCQSKIHIGSGIKGTDDRIVYKSEYFMLWFYCKVFWKQN